MFTLITFLLSNKIILNKWLKAFETKLLATIFTHTPCSMNLWTHNGLINKCNGFQIEMYVKHCWIVHLNLFFQVWMTDVVPTTALSEIKLRLLCHDDIERIKVLCGEWFPIEWVLEPSDHLYVSSITLTHSVICLFVCVLGIQTHGTMTSHQIRSSSLWLPPTEVELWGWLWQK